MRIVWGFLIVLFAGFIISCDRPQSAPTTVIIVRHAEKASDADDSTLTEAGSRRAQALAGVVADAGVSAIYTTQFKRNHETAQPISQRLGVKITQVQVNLQSPGDHGKTLAREIIEKHKGQTVAVVGHGNTIGSIVEGLMGRPVPLGDIQYSDLFVVTVPVSGPARLIKAQYGEGAAANTMMAK